MIVWMDGWMNDSVCGRWSFRVKGLRFQRIGPERLIYFRDLGYYVLGVALPVHGTSIYIACSLSLALSLTSELDVIDGHKFYINKIDKNMTMH